MVSSNHCLQANLLNLSDLESNLLPLREPLVKSQGPVLNTQPKKSAKTLGVRQLRNINFPCFKLFLIQYSLQTEKVKSFEENMSVEQGYATVQKEIIENNLLNQPKHIGVCKTYLE